MQAIIISALEMWPASVSTITTSISPPPTTTGTTITPYRPFEELGFPSPEPPAPPVGELSPPLPGSQWTLSPPAEEQQRASIETVRSYSFANGMRGCVWVNIIGIVVSLLIRGF